MWWFSSTPKSDIEEIAKQLEKTRIERELAIREAIVERKNAYKIAEARERFKWTATAGLAAIIGSVVATVYHKNIFYSIGVLPIFTYVSYDAHKAYGKKLDIIFHEMDNVFKDANQRLSTRMISLKEIDSRVADLLTSPESMGIAQSKVDSDAVRFEKLFDRQMQREIVLAEQLFKEKRALERARLHEIVFWEFLAAGTIAASALFYGMRMKNRFAVVPAVPFIMIAGFHGEMCTDRFEKDVKKEAERILNDPKERKYVQPIGGSITLAELDQRRKRWDIHREIPLVQNVSLTE
ncbi:hypothetical protein M3Y97_00603900 [Aphelenchoides bicaudatus]|nr:hypothetical protein M3Y97_00603900 [Aphelenchoides bicaudatus]